MAPDLRLSKGYAVALSLTELATADYIASLEYLHQIVNTSHGASLIGSVSFPATHNLISLIELCNDILILNERPRLSILFQDKPIPALQP